jgi:putative aldouronate transport system permease protein
VAISISRGERIFNGCNVTFMILLSAWFIIPFVVVASTSVVGAAEAARRGGLVLIPETFDLGAYRAIFTKGSAIIRSYGVTLFRVVVGTALNLLFTAPFAYALSKRSVPGRKPIAMFVFFTILFHGGLIPTYLLVRALGMVNTMWALLIPGAIAAYNMIILRTFFQSIPEDLEESAFLDGAGRWRILASIVLPLSKAGLAAIGLFYALGHWNSYFNALIYLNDAEKYPLTMIVREIVLQEVVAKRQELSGDVFDAEREAKFAAYTQNFRYATVFVSIIPMLIIYPFLQRYLVQGVMIGSLKE